jgi:hypothetical protein
MSMKINDSVPISKVSNSEQPTAAPCVSFTLALESACMTAGDTWTELLTCSNCGMSGPARLSQTEKRAFDFSVEAIPMGFKVVRLEFGEIFFCEACNRPADTR